MSLVLAPYCWVLRPEWLLGYPEKALAGIADSLSLAERIAHPFTLSLVLTFSTVLHLNRRDGSGVRISSGAPLRNTRSLPNAGGSAFGQMTEPDPAWRSGYATFFRLGRINTSAEMPRGAQLIKTHGGHSSLP